MDEIDKLLTHINWLESRGEYDRAQNVRNILENLPGENE